MTGMHTLGKKMHAGMILCMTLIGAQGILNS
jgi:hypothetical protein